VSTFASEAGVVAVVSVVSVVAVVSIVVVGAVAVVSVAVTASFVLSPPHPARAIAPAAEANVITVKVVKGRPTGGIQRPTVDKGDKVVLVVRTDSGEAVHLHGYNIEKEIVPGKPLRLPFTANIAGRFEVELHPTDTLLAVLEVKP